MASMEHVRLSAASVSGVTWKARGRIASLVTLSHETRDVHFRAHVGRWPLALDYLKADLPLTCKASGGTAEGGVVS